MWALQGFGPYDGFGDVVEIAFERDWILGPQRNHCMKEFVCSEPSALEWSAGRLEFIARPAYPHSDSCSSTRQDVQGCYAAGEFDWSMVRKNQYAGSKFYAAGNCGYKGQRLDRIQHNLVSFRQLPIWRHRVRVLWLGWP